MLPRCCRVLAAASERLLVTVTFGEFSFCQLRCNARCDRPHKYPLVVNNCPWSGAPHSEASEHSGILLVVIHRAHKDTGSCFTEFRSP